MPRDYPVRDFLIDAVRKFADFRDETTGCLLVIVWDDFIYEPISMLVNKELGLLNANSFERTENGEARSYANIDMVVAVRHLNYFVSGSREEPLEDRVSAMDFGEGQALPNVSFDVSRPVLIPSHVLHRLRAYPHDDPGLATMAEYNVTDMAFWLPDRPK